MNKIDSPESELTFPYAAPPEFGAYREVAPGVHWLRLPLPMALNHINVWILRDADGLTLVDTGIASDATKEVWESLLEGDFKGLQVKRLICTHYHPDHMGLAGWLVKRTGAQFFCTPAEWEIANFLAKMNDGYFRTILFERYRRAALPHRLAEEFADMRIKRTHFGPLPPSVNLLDLAAPVSAGGTTWRIVVGRGHSPELAALYSAQRRLLISGDQVLPGISPNVSVQPHESDSNPLDLFLTTLRDFRALPSNTLVLPSHKLPFYGLRRRVDDLSEHHVERLQICREACAADATAAEVMAALFPRPLDAHQTYFAIGETIAHLNYLMHAGEVTRVDVAGVDRYRTQRLS